MELTFIQKLNEYIIKKINFHENVLNDLEEQRKSPYCAEGIGSSAALDELYEVLDFIRKETHDMSKL